MKTIRYNVSGMSCAACQARVEKAVKSVPGVESCMVNLLTNSMVVEGDVEPQIIIKSVIDAGYGASIICDNNIAKQSDEAAKEINEIKRRLILSIVFLIALMYLCITKKLMTVQMILALIVMVINRKFFISGVRSVIKGAPNMDTLVAMGSFASFIFKYYDSAAMILTLITVGKLLEAISKGKTTDALKSLIKLTPKNDHIKVGDEFFVKPYESFPVDASIVEGETFVDESSLTGESKTIKKTIGDIVLASTINQNASIKCKAIRVGDDTTLAKIIQMVSDVASSKAPIAKIADKVAGVFVPVVIAIAFITFIVWLISGETLDFALTRAISVLVISCPCSLGLATPVAIMVGSGLGAKNGILFKNATSLEETGKVKIVVLDKTGTITTGKVAVIDKVKEESKTAIEELKSLNLKLYMLSGDKKDVAENIAKIVGIENVISEVLPDGKGDAVIRLKKEDKVAMVGDGINDAVALTAADVGIAIGNGTDVAIDAADVVLMHSKLTDVAKAIRLSRETFKTIKQNLFFAFFYNVIGIPIAAGVFIKPFGIELNPMLCALCMSLSSFCVVTNALRLNFSNINNEKKYNKEGEYMTKKIIIEGMMCGHCEAHAKKELEAVDGVVSATPSHKDGNAIVELSKEVDDATLKAAVEKAGYKVISIS